MTREEKAEKFANEHCDRYARPSGFASARAGYLAGHEDAQLQAEDVIAKLGIALVTEAARSAKPLSNQYDEALATLQAYRGSK